MTGPKPQRRKTDNPYESATAIDTSAAPVDNPYESASADFSDTESGSSTAAAPKHTGMGEGLVNAGSKGASLGFNDELAGAADAFSPSGIGEAIATGKNPVARYKDTRDAVRGSEHDFEAQHPIASTVAEVAGGLVPAVFSGGAGLAARGLKGAVAAGSALGGLSGFGGAEGDIGEQAKSAGKGAALGGLLGGAAATAGRLPIVGSLAGKLADKMPGGARRQAARAAAIVVNPEEAAPILAAREALTPGATAVGDVSKGSSALGSILGKSPKTGITGPMNASQRIAAVKASKAAIGTEYDALGVANPKIYADPVITRLADEAGMPLAPGQTETSFAEIHRLRSEFGARARATKPGMLGAERQRIRADIDDWLKHHVPAVADVDQRYTTVRQQLDGALRSLRGLEAGATRGAVREGGSNQIGADRALSVAHFAQQGLEPLPAKAASAMEDMLFKSGPDNSLAGKIQSMLGQPRTIADRSLGAIGKARSQILQPNQSTMLGRLAPAATGAAMAPQLSDNANGAKIQGAALRAQGMDDDQLAQTLGSQYSPNVVKFIVAATPKRLAQ